MHHNRQHISVRFKYIIIFLITMTEIIGDHLDMNENLGWKVHRKGFVVATGFCVLQITYANLDRQHFAGDDEHTFITIHRA